MRFGVFDLSFLNRTHVNRCILKVQLLNIFHQLWIIIFFNYHRNRCSKLLQSLHNINKAKLIINFFLGSYEQILLICILTLLFIRLFTEKVEELKFKRSETTNFCAHKAITKFNFELWLMLFEFLFKE